MKLAQPWEAVIGLEAHVQLRTLSKIFSGSSTAFGAEPNRQACAIDLGLPGVLPTVNREAVACAIRFALAVGGTVAARSLFARKNYFYPDLPKGYQISQYELPVVQGGRLPISFASDASAGEIEGYIDLTRAHLEEDAGKSLHEDYAGYSGIDLNRAGTPLLEIVSEPQMHSAAQAVAYARSLHALVVWIGICDGNMQEGSFRIDANVSVRRRGAQALGTRCEIKNLNSFRFLEQAITVELQRQVELLEDGGSVVQQTRLYDPDRSETRAMRSKEDAHDYRYFPDPDLPPLAIDPAWIDAEMRALPELPQAMRKRLQHDLGLSAYDAAGLTANRGTADYFEALLGACRMHQPQNPAWPKLCANWVLGEVAAACNRAGWAHAELPVPASRLAAILLRLEDGTISGRTARELFAEHCEPACSREGEAWRPQGPGIAGTHPSSEPGLKLESKPAPEPGLELARLDALIEARGLRQMRDTAALEAWVDQVLDANPRSVAEFRAGKDKALNALVGQVMKLSGGKANPTQVHQLLRERVVP